MGRGGAAAAGSATASAAEEPGRVVSPAANPPLWCLAVRRLRHRGRNLLTRCVNDVRRSANSVDRHTRSPDIDLRASDPADRVDPSVIAALPARKFKAATSRPIFTVAIERDLWAFGPLQPHVM